MENTDAARVARLIASVEKWADKLRAEQRRSHEAGAMLLAAMREILGACQE